MPAGGYGVQGVSRRVGGSLDIEVLEVDGVTKDVGVFVDALPRLLVPGQPQVSGHQLQLCRARMSGLLPVPPSYPQESRSF